MPLAVLGVSFGVMAAIHPNTVRDLFSGAQAVLVTAGLVAGWLVLSRLVLPRLVRNSWLRAGVMSVLAVTLVVVLILPSVVDKKVVEALPRVPEPEASIADDPVGPTTTVATEPTKVASDALVSRGGHAASGTVAIYRQLDGSFVVGLERIDVEPGPDFHVYVVPGRGRENTDGGTRLDSLRGNQGTQYYPVPTTIDFEPGEWTVLIWCRVYAVPVANATPA